MTNKYWKPGTKRPEPWHEIEFIKAISPEGEKFRLGYHFYNGLMRVWMMGCTHHTKEALRDAGWLLEMPEKARR